MESRQIRGYSILAKGDEPRRVDNSIYTVPSQSGNGNYHVTRVHQKGIKPRYVCDCPDFQYRGLRCKHIYCVEFWLNLKEGMVNDVVKTIVPQTEESIGCPFCKSVKVVKKGIRTCKNQAKQRYLCNSCGKRFIQDKDFEKIKATPEMVTAVLDLYFKGVSLRKIADHIGQIHHVEIGKSTIHRWILQYMEKINEYVETLTPEVSGMWHTDEMMVKVNGEWKYLWNTIDHGTRFMLANNITKDRFSSDARQIFSKAKKTAGKDPHLMVTDGLRSYKQAFQDEFYRKKSPTMPRHIAGVGIRGKKHNNNIVERYHGTVRERDKVMRGMKSDRTARVIHNGVKDYYNFVRIHQDLGTTPAEMAGIDLGLKENRWMELLRMSVKSAI